MQNRLDCWSVHRPVSCRCYQGVASQDSEGKTGISPAVEAFFESPLGVEIIQSTSDEGTGLIKYVEKELGAQHSPDLFHVQQELTRGTSAPIAAKVKQAEKAYDTNIKIQERLEKKQSLDPECSEKPYSALDGEIINAELNKGCCITPFKWYQKTSS